MAVKSWSIDPNKVGSINDGGRKLKVGTFPYKITEARSEIDKNDPTGNTQQVKFGLTLLRDPSYTCRVFLSVMADNDQQREIAQRTLVGFAAAAGIGGALKPERLPSFVGKIVVIEAKETAGKGDNADKTYVNINTIEAYNPDGSEDAGDEGGGDEDAAPEEPSDEPTADEQPGSGLTEEEIEQINNDCLELGIDPDPFETWEEARAAVAEARAAKAAAAKKAPAKKGAPAPTPTAATPGKRPWGK